jgi:hypothetical protein
MTARTSTAATNEDVYLRLNGDSTAANYYYHGLYGTGSVAGAENSQSLAGARVAQAHGANDTANAFSASVCDLLNPFSTVKNKSIRTLNGLTASQTRVFFASNSWLSTSALSSITIVGGAGGSFVSGCRFSLYGVRG